MDFIRNKMLGYGHTRNNYLPMFEADLMVNLLITKPPERFEIHTIVHCNLKRDIIFNNFT